MVISKKSNLAYIIGIALGDGNLSNPNGRAVRLRVTCDKKYPKLIKRIMKSLQKIFPHNQVSTIQKSKNCLDISCYSNGWEKLLGWKVKDGPKYVQKVRIPVWIKRRKLYSIKCLKGLFETDGSIYYDRHYIMANFTTIIPELAKDMLEIIKSLGYQPNLQIINFENRKTRYNIRITKNSESFIKKVGINKN